MGLFSRSATTMKYEMMSLGVPGTIAEILAAASKVEVSQLAAKCPRPRGDTRTNYRWVEDGIRYLKRTDASEMRMNLVEGMCWAVFDHGADETFRREYAAQEMPLVGAGPSASDLQMAMSRPILARQGQRYWNASDGDPVAVLCQAVRPGKEPLGGLLVLDSGHVGFFDAAALTSDDAEAEDGHRWFASINMVDGLEVEADQALNLKNLSQTYIGTASRDTELTVIYYDQDLERCTASFLVPREDFYSAMGLYNRSAFTEIVSKLDALVAEWKEDYYGSPGSD